MKARFENNYEILNVCGEGGLATIYRVRNRVTGKVEAFKRLNINTPAAKDALQREYHFLSLHRHPKLPVIGGYWETPDGPGFTMEFIQGSPLAALCGKLDDKQLESVFLQMLEIAQFINHCGYIYSDYKPANFLLMANGQIRLIDFNLVTPECESGDIPSGTIQYLAPELLKGGSMSPAIDIYSLGICFYEILSGRLPFDADNIDQLLKIVSESEPPPLNISDNNVKAAIRSMISRNPADRPGSPFAAAALFGWQEQLTNLIAANADAYLDSAVPAFIPEQSKAKSSPSDPLVQYLKKHSVPDELQSVLRHLGKGNPAVVRMYLKFMIDERQLVYGNKGWSYAGGFDETLIPPKVASEHEKFVARLDLKARKLLEWLAVADDRLKSDALAELEGVGYSNIESSLQSLVSENTIESDENGFRITNRSLSIYIAQRIAEKDRRAMHLRLAQYLENRSPGSLDAIATHYYEACSWEKAFDFSQKAAAAFFGSFDLPRAQWHSAKSIQIIESGFPENLSEESRIAALILAGDIAKAAADHISAESYYLRAAAICKKDHPGSLALIDKNLGDLYRIMQKTGKSLIFSNRALDYYRKSNDRAMQAACLNNIGLASWNLGDYHRAESHFIEALEINRQLGNLVEQSKLHSNIGIIRDITGRKTEVLEQFELALDCARKTDNLERQAVVLNNIGFFHLNSGDSQTALNYFIESRRIAHASGLTQLELDIVSNIGWAYHELGDFLKSVNYNQETLDLAGRLEQSMAGARAALLITRDCLALGNYKLALNALREAERLSRDISNNELAADIILMKILFSYKTELEKAPSDLLDQISRFDNLTVYQNLQRRYWVLKFADNRKSSDVIDKCKELLLSAASGKYDDLLLLSTIRVAELYIAAGEAGPAAQVLENALAPGAGITTRIAAEIALAAAYIELEKFDRALDRTARSRSLAEKSGCLPDLFLCNLMEAGIYRRCGKTKTFFKAIKSAESIFKLLSANYVALSGRESPVGFAGVDKYIELKNAVKSSPAGLGDPYPKENRPGRAVFIS